MQHIAVTKPEPRKTASRPTWQRIAACSLAGLLAALMLFSTLSSVFAGAVTTQKTVNDLKDKLSNTTKRKKQLESELASLKTNKGSLSNQIAKTDEQLAAAEEEIETQQQLIDELTSLIATKEIELADSQAKEDAQYEKMRMRVRFLYENGDLSYLGILLSADDFGDFLNRYEIISQISGYEKQMFEDLKVIKQQVADQKLSLESDKEQQVALKAELVANKKELDKLRDAQATKLKALEAAEADAKDAYKEIVFRPKSKKPLRSLPKSRAMWAAPSYGRCRQETRGLHATMACVSIRLQASTSFIPALTSAPRVARRSLQRIRAPLSRLLTARPMATMSSSTTAAAFPLFMRT